MRGMLTACKKSALGIIAAGGWRISTRRYAEDRVMKIDESRGDYSNETFNKILANQPP